MFSALSAAYSVLISISSSIFADTAKQTKPVNGINLYILIPIIIVVILVVLSIFSSESSIRVPKWLYYILAAAGRALAITAQEKDSSRTDMDSLSKAITAAGYSYEPKQDIFYSNMDAWQKNFGYCRLYDEAAILSGVVIDCEPIYFEYENKRWMIELWKGQYYLNSGCEVGIYNTKDHDINVPGTFSGTFYYCADDKDQLHISYALKKNDKTLFTRKGRHWWLTGFKLGEYSEPSELTMDIYITLKNKAMLNAFLSGLKTAGYLENEIFVNLNTVGLKFDKPRNAQPYTRNSQTDWIIQRNNKFMCDKYREITGPYNNFQDKMKALQTQDLDIYNTIINIGKTRNLFSAFEIIRKYLKQ
ncbi:MAG: DUF4474 domain-containing protein [Bacillota bacterium]|nr:DUF4474 domain-containing protein [Bacillota bacterium]